MRVLLYLAELAVVVLLAWAVYRTFRRLAERREEVRALSEARWKRRIVALDDGRVRVEVAKRGAEKAIPVQTLDPEAEGFEVAVYEAEARADDLALSLNAGEDA